MTLTERIRLAQELHDGIAQDLVGVGYRLDLIISDQGTSTNTRMEIRRVRLDIARLLDNIRAEIHDLHEVSSKSFNAQIRDVTESICIDHEIKFDLPNDQIFLPDETSYQVMRIIRELLRNIVRHARATHVTLCLTSSNEAISLSLTDDGQGEIAHEAHTFGLMGSADRARSIGGSLTWHSDLTGFRAILRFPHSQKNS